MRLFAIFAAAVLLLASCSGERCLECDVNGRIDYQCYKTDAEYETAITAVCNTSGLECYCPD